MWANVVEFVAPAGLEISYTLGLAAVVLYYPCKRLHVWVLLTSWCLASDWHTVTAQCTYAVQLGMLKAYVQVLLATGTAGCMSWICGAPLAGRHLPD